MQLEINNILLLEQIFEGHHEALIQKLKHFQVMFQMYSAKCNLPNFLHYFERQMKLYVYN